MDLENKTQDRQEVERLIHVLTTAMRILDLSNREVERRLNLSPSYLSRLFNGLIELRVERLLAISRAIGLEPAEFFYLAYPRLPEPPSNASQKLRAVLQEMHPTPPPSRSARPSASEIETRVREAIKKILDDIERNAQRSQG